MVSTYTSRQEKRSSANFTNVKKVTTTTHGKLAAKSTSEPSKPFSINVKRQNDLTNKNQTKWHFIKLIQIIYFTFATEMLKNQAVHLGSIDN